MFFYHREKRDYLSRASLAARGLTRNRRACMIHEKLMTRKKEVEIALGIVPEMTHEADISPQAHSGDLELGISSWLINDK